MYHSFSSHDNISDSSSDHSQVLRIDCDAPVATEHTIYQTTEHTITSEPMTTEQTSRQTIQFNPTPDTSGKDECSSIIITTSTNA